MFATTRKTLLTAILILIVLSSSAWQGDYTVRAASQNTSIAEAVLVTFGKTAPANGAINLNPASIAFSWQAYSPTPDAYSYCVKEGSACAANDPHWTRTGLNTSVTLTNLAHGKTYYWQVRAIFCGNCVPKVFVYADDGAVWTFTTRLSQVTIVGNVGVAGAVLSYMDGTLKTVTANSSGAYSITVPFNWSGTVTPSKAGYFFSPRSASFTNLTVAQTIQNFTALVAYSISGNAGLPGIPLNYVDITPQTVTSDSSGNYSFLVPSGWSGTVTPSNTCFTFNPPNRTYSNVTANQTAQNYTATFNAAAGCADIDVLIAGNNVGSYIVPPGQSLRVAYSGVNNGPAKIVSVNNVDILSALRVIWREPGPRFSYSEMMGLPKEQLSNEYWFPWYNNAATNSMDQGFRIANVDTAAGNTVEVWVGNTILDTITLGAGASIRVGYSVDNGPVRIVCTTCTNTGSDKIIAALRVIWREPGSRTSYSEMMGLPKEQLSTQYWFPWYNNATPNVIDQGFRIANVDSSQHTIQVWVGATKLTNPDITLAGGASIRVSYNVDNGPIRVVCTDCSNPDDKIIVALRVIWKEPGYRSSYSEMMGLPNEALSTEYWFPWYNFAAPNSMDQGFRIAVP